MGNLDQPVAGERVDGIAIEAVEPLRRTCDQAKDTRAPLTERPGERRLSAQRLVAAAARWAPRRERAHPAARNAREAHRRAEVHQRPRRAAAEGAAASLLHAPHVRVHRQHRLAPRETGDGVRGVPADSGKLRQVARPPDPRDDPGRLVQGDGTAVVAEPLPGADDVAARRRGQRFGIRPAIEPRQVARDDALDLRLLEHDLGDEDRVRVSRLPPGKLPAVLREPGEQSFLHAARL